MDNRHSSADSSSQNLVEELNQAFETMAEDATKEYRALKKEEKDDKSDQTSTSRSLRY